MFVLENVFQRYTFRCFLVFVHAMKTVLYQVDTVFTTELQTSSELRCDLYLEGRLLRGSDDCLCLWLRQDEHAGKEKTEWMLF